MKQKILSLIFIAIFGIAAKAQTIVDSGDGWSLDSEGLLTITKDFTFYYSSDIPWYASRNNVKSVVIAEGVTEIAEYAFQGCSGLTSVTIPKGVTSIGNYAFYDCSGLTSVMIPKGVMSIGYFAFEGCDIEELHLESVESYCNISFGYGSSPLSSAWGDVKLYVGEDEVTSLVIPEGVKTINDSAFKGCSGLTSVTIPKSVMSIGSSAFEYCYDIEELHLGSVESYCNISFGYGSSPLYSVWGDVKLYVGEDEVTSLVIPDGVTAINDYAFKNCLGLTSVTIPEGVGSIGDYAFSGCSGLTGDLTIPEGVESIGDYAFSGCSGLTSIEIPSSVKSIGSSAFFGCDIEELHLGSFESYCNISFGNFYSSPSYSVRSDTKLYVGEDEVTSIVIPDDVTTINCGAFQGCSGLTSITIPSTVKIIDDYAFSGCSGLTSVTIPEGVEGIGNNAFSSCSGLTSVTIPESVKSIGNNAFSSCSGLTSVTIPEGVEGIGGKAFVNCSGLVCVDIRPTNVEYNQDSDDETQTFYNCDELKYVFLYQTSVVNNLTDIFPTYKTIDRFFVPDDILAYYRSQYASNNDLKDKFTGFSLIEKRGANDTEEVVALSLEKGSYNFIAWAVNNGEKVREDEEISIVLTHDFDLDADNVTWQTLGTAEHPFKGIFEGNTLSVIGNRRADAVQPKSIFGYIGEGAEIRNVVFSDFIIDATSAGVTDGGKTYYGLVARENKGLIRNSIFEGRMEIDADADDIENAEACLVIDNEEGGELDHVIGYFEGLDGEVTGNKASIIVIQNIGHGRTRGHKKKSASNGKTKSKGNSTVSAEVPDDINLNYRLFTDEEFAGAEPAYWLNFDGEGYSGDFNGDWAQGTKHPVLAKDGHLGATVGIRYNVENRDESVLGMSPVFFAASKSSVEVEYSEKPLSIEVNGTEIDAAQLGDMKAKFSLASIDTNSGNVNVVLKYEKQSTPTAVEGINADGSKNVVKTVENGRVVIIRNGVKYDLAGRVLGDK
ncbi:MAG: leucine-rich repeat domain-containing protein [Bacteroidales bacterium]|nr:leucine-rich repeat domain-containing protein [Bacteroidales bacterium]